MGPPFIGLIPLILVTYANGRDSLEGCHHPASGPAGVAVSAASAGLVGPSCCGFCLAAGPAFATGSATTAVGTGLSSYWVLGVDGWVDWPASRSYGRSLVCPPSLKLRWAAFARRDAAGEGWWEVLVTLQSSLPTCLKTPVLQTGSRITSKIGLPRRSSKRGRDPAGVMARLRWATARQPRSRAASSEGW